MDNVSRRGLFGLIFGWGGVALADGKASLFEPALASTTNTVSAHTRFDGPPRTSACEVGDVCEVSGRFESFNLEDRYGYPYGFLREQGGDRRILVHDTCLRTAGITKVSTDAIYRCAVLRRPKGWQAYRILDTIESAA